MKSLSAAGSPLRALHSDIALKLLTAAAIVGIADRRVAAGFRAIVRRRVDRGRAQDLSHEHPERRREARGAGATAARTGARENLQHRGTTTLQPVVDDLRQRFPNVAISAAGDLDKTVGLSAENTMIILSHLLDNAVWHNATDVTMKASAQNGVLTLAVGNNGDAISEPNRDRVFDAFFTTRRESGGTGMGLAIVQSMLRTHGGSIALARPDGGAAFNLYFPAA